MHALQIFQREQRACSCHTKNPQPQPHTDALPENNPCDQRRCDNFKVVQERCAGGRRGAQSKHQTNRRRNVEHDHGNGVRQLCPRQFGFQPCRLPNSADDRNQRHTGAGSQIKEPRHQRRAAGYEAAAWKTVRSQHTKQLPKQLRKYRPSSHAACYAPAPSDFRFASPPVVSVEASRASIRLAKSPGSTAIWTRVLPGKSSTVTVA